MNTAFLDAQNLAWKIHLVESGFANRSILQTYESERKSVAESLLDFDAKYAALFSTRRPSAGDVGAASEVNGRDKGADLFVELFKSSCEFTSGYGVSYGPNILNWSPDHPARSPLFRGHATTLRIGGIMPTATVTRVADANVVQLEQEVPVNGSFRIFLFAGALSRSKQALSDFAAHLDNRRNFYRSFERTDISMISYHERHNPHSLFYTICTILAARRDEVEISAMVPDVLARYRGHIYADDVADSRVPQATAAAHAKMCLDQEKGGVVVVRPDGYVGCVVSLAEGGGTVEALNDYFGTFTTKNFGKAQVQAQL